MHQELSLSHPRCRRSKMSAFLTYFPRMSTPATHRGGWFSVVGATICNGHAIALAGKWAFLCSTQRRPWVSNPAHSEPGSEDLDEVRTDQPRDGDDPHAPPGRDCAHGDHRNQSCRTSHLSEKQITHKRSITILNASPVRPWLASWASTRSRST